MKGTQKAPITPVMEQRGNTAVIALLVFLSGFAGLIYEVLWMKQVGLLFGNTSHAAAATLAAFFSGLAVGSWFWGQRSAKAQNALRLYAGLELGIAATALLYFGVLQGYHAVYPLLFQSVGSGMWLLLIKFGLALLLVFPPAFFMGGTIPVIGQYLVLDRAKFGSAVALLYGVNTLGAALGACMAGFYLPLWLGFKATCLGAIGVTLSVAALAWQLSRAVVQEAAASPKKKRPAARVSKQGHSGAVTFLCFISGFGVLALEVLWTRMFAQVLENSVYTFTAILVIVLLCLGGGAWLSSRLARLQVSASLLLSVLVLAGGIAVALTPHLFMYLTDSLQIVVSTGTWSSYVALIFRKGFLAIGAPALLLGTIFPFLMKLEEQHASSPGQSLGRLAAINTAGAILGSLLCGFVFLGNFGMWRTMQLIALLYLGTALILSLLLNRFTLVMSGVSAVMLVLLLTVLNPAQLPVTSVDPMGRQREVVETWEGSDCTVAVVRSDDGLSIKINSHYGLGSTGARPLQWHQCDIPLLAFPESKSVFFLGMGTGITAGSALDPQFPNVRRVVACELVPEVVAAARKYMTNVEGEDYTGGLFTDPRATVLVEDGRHYLMATQEKFDIVNADLFVPYRSGAGSLYSKEHFESIKDRLTPDGVFFQWLPLYQLTENELFIITRTMLEVFDQVSLWRNNFQPGEDVVALVGHKRQGPLPAVAADSLGQRRQAIEGKDYRDLDQLLLPFDSPTIPFFYCGNLTAAKSLFAGYPVNTDDHPFLEYMAPRSYRNHAGQGTPWFVGALLAGLVDEIQRICPPEQDPLLANRSQADRLLPAAGAAYHWAWVWALMGNSAEQQRAWQRFGQAWTGGR